MARYKVGNKPMYTLYVYSDRLTFNLGRANCIEELTECFETMDDLMETMKLMERFNPKYMFEIVKEGG